MTRDGPTACLTCPVRVATRTSRTAPPKRDLSLAMGLIKPPSLLTFLAATALIILAILARLGFVIPGGGEIGFWLLLAANVLFVMGCLTRGL